MAENVFLSWDLLSLFGTEPVGLKWIKIHMQRANLATQYTHNIGVKSLSNPHLYLKGICKKVVKTPQGKKGFCVTFFYRVDILSTFLTFLLKAEYTDRLLVWFSTLGRPRCWLTSAFRLCTTQPASQSASQPADRPALLTNWYLICAAIGGGADYSSVSAVHCQLQTAEGLAAGSLRLNLYCSLMGWGEQWTLCTKSD